MVRGLNVFRERFAGCEDRYVLIGGAAVEIAMDVAALAFRVTKDLDIVLHVESLDAEFAAGRGTVSTHTILPRASWLRIVRRTGSS